MIAVLTDSADPQNYWRVLKKRLKDEGNETITNCNGLKMTAPDGKKRKTDVANTEQLLRIIQSIPSPKAEPFKAWLAMVGKERIEETIDPEQAIDRALDTYLKKGYSEEWIHQRLLAIRIRNELTDEWKKRGVQKGKEYAILTDEISRAWSGMTTGQYKRLKGLTKENLRDNMTDLELVLNCVNKLRSPILVLDFPRSGESSGGGLAPHHWHFSHPVFVMTGLRVTEVPFVKYRTIELFTCQGTYGRFLDFDGRKTSFYLVADEKGHFVALQAIL